MPKNAENFYCKECDFVCCKKSNYDKHISTRKHKILTNTYKKMPDDTGQLYECECGKHYKHRQSLYTHKKKCKFIIDEIVEEEKVEQNESKYDKLIDTLMKQNDNLQDKLLKANTKIKNVNNNKFNLNVFLNNDCKDAMNLMDFVNKVETSVSTLDYIKEKGFVGGISKLLLEGLNNMEVTNRPVHCTDLKRETIYIKNNDTWEKDNDENDKMKEMITRVSRKNLSNLQQWVQKNPDCTNTGSNMNADYHKLLQEALNHGNDKEVKKIIKKISKHISVKEEK
tara:strand:+ start:17587 stop:18432 length:846 start_codon:yes stop_codon:yes gene_type:complete